MAKQFECKYCGDTIFFVIKGDKPVPVDYGDRAFPNGEYWADEYYDAEIHTLHLPHCGEV